MQWCGDGFSGRSGQVESSFVISYVRNTETKDSVKTSIPRRGDKKKAQPYEGMKTD